MAQGENSDLSLRHDLFRASRNLTVYWGRPDAGLRFPHGLSVSHTVCKLNSFGDFPLAWLRFGAVRICRGLQLHFAAAQCRRVGMSAKQFACAFPLAVPRASRCRSRGCGTAAIDETRP
jgi:hypothetical protein